MPVAKRAKPEPPPFGQQLRAARRTAGIPTQLAAAQRLGMVRTNYHRLETRCREPGWFMLRRLVLGLDLPLEQFFPDETILAAARRLKRPQRRKRQRKRPPDGATHPMAPNPQ